MKSKINTKTTILLELEEDEAKWLRDLLQNPLHGLSPDEEPAEDRMMRGLFFRNLENDIPH